MKPKRPKARVFVAMGVALLLLAACGTSQPSPAATPAPSPRPSPTVAPSPAPTAEVVVWEYVALGESMNFEMIRLYAEMLEEDLGVEIELHDRALMGDHSSRLLERLRTDEALRQEIRDAEVITFQIPIAVVVGPFRTFEFEPSGACGGEDNQDCLREAFGTYMADTDGILAEIVALRSPSEALIRAQDVYQIKVRETQESGTFETMNGYWREANEHLIQVATEHDIPVARVYDAFMGEDGIEDPRDRGLMATDGLHPSAEGAVLMAELFRELGYQYAVPKP